MTTSNLRKWIWVAKVIRHITEVCFNAAIAFVAGTSATILSAMEFIAITNEKALYLKGSFLANFISATGILFIVAGWFFIRRTGNHIICGRKDYVFGQKRNYQLLQEMDGAKFPSDAIKDNEVTFILTVYANAICFSCFLSQILSDVFPNIVVPFIPNMMWVSIISIIVVAIFGIILAVYLRYCKTRLEILLGRRQPRRYRPQFNRRKLTR